MSQPTNRKVKKLNDDGVSESVEKPAKKAANKPAKLPTVFKLGKWNPDTVLVKPEEELEKSSHKDTLLNNCCTRCNNRNVVRAVLTNNLSLLKKCMNAKETVPSLTSQWAIDTPFLNPVDLIIKSQNQEMLKTVLTIPSVKSGADYNDYYSKAMNYLRDDRVRVRDTLLNRIDTGRVSYKAYGAAIRSV